MRFVTVRTPDGTRAARVEVQEVVLLDPPDVGALLQEVSDVRRAESVDGPRLALELADLAPVVPRPGKIVCVGLNYTSHIEEMGRQLPAHPTLFAKYAECLIGARDPIVIPPESQSVDWEVELAVLIGAHVRRARRFRARSAIAGFSVLNDISMRDWQSRTGQFLSGKTWESSTPLGPALVTADEVGDGSGLDLLTEVDGQVMQRGNTDDLLFGPVELVEYISTIVSLAPGDVIATGTPGGVGAGRKPPIFLQRGATLRTAITGLGETVNTCLAG